jgi:hypothetical protein
LLLLLGTFVIGSSELFAQAGLEPWFSWSLPTKQLGLKAWVTSAWQKPIFAVHKAPRIKNPLHQNPNLLCYDHVTKF